MGLIWLPVPNYTPQQPLRGKERWGRPESGRALMLAATEPQVIRTTGDLATEGEGHRWRTQPHEDSKIETDLVASATGNHITSSNADTTQNGPPPPPHTHHTPTAPPTPHQH